MSGSIACAKATGLISAWIKAGHEVRVVTTPTVEEFVGPSTLEGLSGQPVLDDVFAPGQIMDHVNLARWADLLVVAPATSNLIAKFAAGIADDAPTTLWQAAFGRGYPLVIVPAMNTRMWVYPATRGNVAKLRGWGVHVLPTAEGRLADGEFGEGRMLEVDEILARVEALFAARATGRRVLVTGGGTREPVDPVRYLGNMSTGRTAATLADELAERGFEVTWLGAEAATQPESVARLLHYVTFDDLEASLERLLREERFDAVIHAAAVSDYAVERVVGPGGEAAAALDPEGKIPSGMALELRLKPNPKLVDRLHEWSSNPDLRVVAFKLTATPDAAAREAAVRQLFDRAGAEAVVHNDLGEISEGRHPFTACLPDGTRQHLDDVAALAGWLDGWMESAA